MKSPSTSVRVRVDAQGRLVLPRRLRDELVDVPGEVVIRRTAEGLLLGPVPSEAEVFEEADGLPVLRVGRKVSNDEVLDAISAERAER